MMCLLISDFVHLFVCLLVGLYGYLFGCLSVSLLVVWSVSILIDELLVHVARSLPSHYVIGGVCLMGSFDVLLMLGTNWCINKQLMMTYGANMSVCLFVFIGVFVWLSVVLQHLCSCL